MQTMQRPDGSSLQEFFTRKQIDDGGAQRRRELLEAVGYTFNSLKPVGSKYLPHQGNREIQRRLKWMPHQTIDEAMAETEAVK